MRKQYEERDIISQGGYYATHVQAMTAEGLHSKYDIAAELAHRDERIAELEKAIHYATDYLDDNKLNSIGHGSKAHMELKEALKEGK